MYSLHAYILSSPQRDPTEGRESTGSRMKTSVNWTRDNMFQKFTKILITALLYLTIIWEGRVTIVEDSLRRSRENYFTIFTNPEVNNCLSVITRVIIKSNYIFFSFIILISSLETSANRKRPFCASVLCVPHAG